jgi:hypothetical protein
VSLKCLETITDRNGRCYELTMRVMLQEPGAQYCVLVHGRITDVLHDRVIAHAWIEVADSCYDAVLDQYFPTDLYLSIATAEVRYTYQQALDMYAKYACWGPWHD